VPFKGIQIPKELLAELGESERKGWYAGSFRKSLDDRHMHLLCKHLYNQYKTANEPEWNLAQPSVAAVEANNNSQTRAVDSGGAEVNDSKPQGDAAEREDLPEASWDTDGDKDEDQEGLSEETHLFAKFTSTYKVQDFLDLDGGGEQVQFPSNVLVDAAMVFSDLSGFSKLCESYVEKYANIPSAGAAMSQAAEKLNVVVNSVFALQIKLVEEYNGDVVNFAGDAMFVLFRADDLKVAAQRAAACSLAMLAETDKRLKSMEEMGVDALDSQLFLHIGVGAGKIRAMTYGGGVYDKAEFVAAGPGLTEAKDAGELAKMGEMVISRTVLDLCQDLGPKVEKVPPEKLAAEGLEGFEFYVLNSLQQTPALPSITMRQECLMRLSKCDNADVQEAMRRFVPHSISACVDYGQSPKEAEECRRVTIMFIRLLDIQCDPFDYSKPETVEVIQKCICEIYSVLGRYEGTVSRFQIDDKGTVLKIVFGFPMMAHEDDPVRAVHAAIEIRKNLKERLTVQSCLGIATGTTICGLVGNEVRLEYTAVGSSVILAARLMQNANCCILVNTETQKASSGSAVFEKICSIKVKGKDAKVPVYRPVESERRITKKLAPVRDNSGILGRDIEINKLRQHLEEYVNAWKRKESLRCCVISGPAGIGKATVLGRFLGIITERSNPAVRVLKASAEAIESKTPYYPWKKIFAKLLGVDAGKQATQFTHRACMNSLRNILGDDFEEHEVLNDVLPTHIPTLGARMNHDTRARSEKLTELLCMLLNKAIEREPVAIVIHACQWLDNSSYAFLKQVMLRAVFPLLVILTTRSQEVDVELSEVVEAGVMVDQIALEPFSPDMSVQLVRKTLGAIELEDQVKEAVWSRSHGIPLYCVEFARAVKDSGGAPLNELPDTITGAVLLRIDRLLPAQKLVLKIVAVAGKDVSKELIAEVAPAQFSPEDLQTELETLVSEDILFRDTRNGYCFRHEMVQEVVLGFLTFSQKRLLHKRIANYHLNAAEEVSPAALANHFEHAARGMDAADLDVPTAKRAVWFLKAAAEEAMKANAHADAQKYMARHADLWNILPASAEPFDLEMALGLVDGNEKLLKQVLDQFITNTSTSLENLKTTLAKAIEENAAPSAADTGNSSPEQRKKKALGSDSWRDTMRFGAQGIASAASTLGASLLSQKAETVESSVLEATSPHEIIAELQALEDSFKAVKAGMPAGSGQESVADGESAEKDGRGSGKPKESRPTSKGDDLLDEMMKEAPKQLVMDWSAALA